LPVVSVIDVVRRVPVDAIAAEADRVDVGRLLLTAVAGLLFAVGWVAGKAFTVVVSVVVWSVAAVKVGWVTARPAASGEGG